ncbi:s-adenosylmethionine decarboxylase proenzyme, partial [Genlisea aurea]
MAVSGFEGFEKRLELRFSGEENPATGRGLRSLDFFILEEILAAVQCTVVSAVSNPYFDSYVLSESSLFVYPYKIIIKTCGTTRLLRSVRLLADQAVTVGLSLRWCRYTRGSFIFPEAQPRPHTSFLEEVAYLERNLPEELSGRRSGVMNSGSRDSWHVFTAVVDGDDDDDDFYTLEICMTELDPVSAGKFFRRSDGGRSSGKEMTERTGIGGINERALICDFAFDPCGYSMNGLDGDRYSTVHVTPEEGFSYASFESVGSFRDGRKDLGEVLRAVVKIFRPGKVSVATTCSAEHQRRVWRAAESALHAQGMQVSSREIGEFPAAGGVVFQTFT